MLNGLGGDAFTRNVRHTYAQTDGQQIDFGKKLLYLFFYKKKSRYNNVS